MDLVDVLNEDHERLRNLLMLLEGQIRECFDASGSPAGWEIRSEPDLRRELAELLKALGRHEAVEEGILFKALVEAGTLDTAPFKDLEQGHRDLERLTERLSRVLEGGAEAPKTWLLAAVMKLVEELRAHMLQEEYSLFPFVRSTLPAAVLQKLGIRAEPLLGASKKRHPPSRK